MAAEPTQVPIAITMLVATTLEPSVGNYVLLIFAALTGGLLGLSKAGVATRWEGARHLALSVAMSLVLTSAGVWLVQRYTALPGNMALMPVSFFIAASKDFLLGFIQGVLTNILSFFSRK